MNRAVKLNIMSNVIPHSLLIFSVFAFYIFSVQAIIPQFVYWEMELPGLTLNVIFISNLISRNVIVTIIFAFILLGFDYYFYKCTFLLSEIKAQYYSLGVTIILITVLLFGIIFFSIPFHYLNIN